MSVEEQTIDSQHKKLIDQINKLIEVIKPGSELNTIRETSNFLNKYIKEHFDYEEEYMKKIGFPRLENHKKIHKLFVEFFNKFKAKFNQELYSKPKPGEFVSDKLKKVIDGCKEQLGMWLKNHILGEDQKYHRYAREKGLLKKKNKMGSVFNMSAVKAEIQKDLKKGKIEKHHVQILEQRAPAKHIVENIKQRRRKTDKKYVFTGVTGFDDLLEKGIPKGSSILLAGGAGSGKTIFGLQTLIHHANKGEKCLYMSFEESEGHLIEHMEDFGWNPKELIKKKNLLIKRFNPFEITRSVDALLMKAKGELLIDVEPVVFPQGFKPDYIVVDSLTAIASAFTGKEESYRIYIEQLFRFFEKINATSFLITETKQIPTIFSQSGVEEFLADGVIVLYNFKRGDVRENGIEILKLRGAKHQKKVVAMQISDEGMNVYSDQEVFGDVE